MTTRREEAAARVRSLHPPLPVLFAALRADLGDDAPPAPGPPPAPAPSPFDGVDMGHDPEDLALRLLLAIAPDLDAAATDAAFAMLLPYATAAVAGEPLPADLPERLREATGSPEG
jgi:hypothetical protein